MPKFNAGTKPVELQTAPLPSSAAVSGVKDEIRHGIVLAIARPECGLTPRGRDGDKSIGNLDMVAFAVLAEVLARQLAHLLVDGNACERGEEPGDRLHFGVARACAHLRDGDWRNEDR